MMHFIFHILSVSSLLGSKIGYFPGKPHSFSHICAKLAQQAAYYWNQLFEQMQNFSLSVNVMVMENCIYILTIPKKMRQELLLYAVT